MKKVRIGCGAGCSYDRVEPAIDLVEKGNLDYIVFECLAERTVADDQLREIENPGLGYTPMLEERMNKILKPAIEKGVKIITNMGSANPIAATKKIKEISNNLGIKGFKIATIIGDNITHIINSYQEVEMSDRKIKLREILDDIVSANIYFGSSAITEALDNGADIVITGRVADVSLFVGPLVHEFDWKFDDQQMGQASYLGHLLECAGQVTGGFFAEPGSKDIVDLYNLGFPIAEIGEDGIFTIEKLQGTAGEVSLRTVKEQTLYEVGDPKNYITPDAILDMSSVQIEQIEVDKVRVKGADTKGRPDTYKVNIAYFDGFIADGEVSFGGSKSVKLAKLCSEMIDERLKVVNANLSEVKKEIIGCNSLYGDKIMKEISNSDPYDVRLRYVGRASSYDDAKKLAREFSYLYTNGPAGTSGCKSGIKEVIAVSSIIIDKEGIEQKIIYEEV